MLQKKYEDYLEEMYKLFPDVEEKSIQNIIEYGLKKIHSYVKGNNEILMKDQETILFIGPTEKESVQQSINSAIKEHIKYRRLFLDQKIVWDGFHYFGLTEAENVLFKKNKLSVDLYKLMNECSIRLGIKYIYKINLNYSIPVNKIPWRETREVDFNNVTLSEEGMKKLKMKEKKAMKFKEKEKNEEN